MALEHPRLWGGLVDLPPIVDTPALAHVCAVLAGAGDEDQLAIRTSGVFVRRLTPAPVAKESPAPQWKPRGTVLVTGGTGALGPRIARWLARNGAEHVVLASRRGAAAPGAAQLETELAALGRRITPATCDVTDRNSIRELVERLDASGDSIRAVVHAAAVIKLAPLSETTVDEFAEVVSAKVSGAVYLEELLDEDTLDACVYFSSIAGVWGSATYGAYASANSFLEAMAEQRRTRGLKATSIAWGPWGDARLPEGVVIDGDHLRRQGLPSMDPDAALAALQQVLDHDDAVMTVADVDWKRFLPVFTSARSRPLFNDIPDVAELLAMPGDDDRDDSLQRRLAQLPKNETLAALLTLVSEHAAAVLGHESGRSIPAGKPFKEMGFDSLTAVQLRNQLNRETGLSLPATLVFDHPTPAAVSRYIETRLMPESTSPEALVHQELDRIEAALSSIGPADRARPEITARLRTLSRLVDQTIPDSAVPDGGGDLETVSDEEMFDLIDREFGER
jgi:NAD(P)-dependent dehydrogenase (short-subunit alcohol dehydrogenase family)/acyl carrier protein